MRPYSMQCALPFNSVFILHDIHKRTTYLTYIIYRHVHTSRAGRSLNIMKYCVTAMRTRILPIHKCTHVFQTNNVPHNIYLITYARVMHTGRKPFSMILQQQLLQYENVPRVYEAHDDVEITKPPRPSRRS